MFFFLIDIPQSSQSQPQAKTILTVSVQKTLLCGNFCTSKYFKNTFANILFLFKLTGFVAGTAEGSLWKAFFMLSDILRGTLQNHLKFPSAGFLHDLVRLGRWPAVQGVTEFQVCPLSSARSFSHLCWSPPVGILCHPQINSGILGCTMCTDR